MSLRVISFFYHIDNYGKCEYWIEREYSMKAFLGVTHASPHSFLVFFVKQVSVCFIGMHMNLSPLKHHMIFPLLIHFIT
jgi:hypothetical protein